MHGWKNIAEWIDEQRRLQSCNSAGVKERSVGSDGVRGTVEVTTGRYLNHFLHAPGRDMQEVIQFFEQDSTELNTRKRPDMRCNRVSTLLIRFMRGRTLST